MSVEGYIREQQANRTLYISAWIGEVVTLQSLYYDETGAPSVLSGLPTVTAYYYNSSSERVTVVDGQEMTLVDPGLYKYDLDVPDSMRDGQAMFVDYRAVDSLSGAVSVSQDTLSLYARNTRPGGLYARFVP